MCNVISAEFVNPRTRYGYRVVKQCRTKDYTIKPGVFRSFIQPQQRSQTYSLADGDPRRFCRGRGKVLYYLVGRETVSPSGPGIMLFTTLRHAKKYAYGTSGVIIRCRIPQGAYLYEASVGWERIPCLCASRVHVLEKV